MNIVFVLCIWYFTEYYLWIKRKSCEYFQQRRVFFQKSLFLLFHLRNFFRLSFNQKFLWKFQSISCQQKRRKAFFLPFGGKNFTGEISFKKKFLSNLKNLQENKSINNFLMTEHFPSIFFFLKFFLLHSSLTFPMRIHYFSLEISHPSYWKLLLSLS